MSHNDNEHRGKRAAIYMMTFIMGGCGIAYEYTFSKISADLLGNSVHQWAITIGLMMLFMGIGSDLEKHIEDKNLFDKFVIFEVLLALVGAFGPVLLLYTFGSFRDHYVLVQYGATVSVGFLIGLEIPILTRLNEQFSPELRVNLGGVLRMDYIGAFAGALVWVFVLPRFFTLTQMGFVLGCLNLCCVFLALLYFKALVHRGLAIGLGTLVCLVALIAGLVQTPAWTKQAEQRLYLDRIIYSETTKYQHIVMTQSGAGDIFCYINGNTQFASYDEYIYHEMLVHPAMLLAPKRRNILILGGGDGLALREILKYPDVEHVTLVDLDPGMTHLAKTNEALAKLNNHALDNARVSVVEGGGLKPIKGQTQTVTTPSRSGWFEQGAHPVAEVALVNIDASLFVDQISGSYDVIIVDFPDPNNLELAKLYSQSFYSRLVRKLNRDGILVQQATSPVYTREAYLCIGRTMASAGFSTVPYHDNVPSFGEWGFWLATRQDNASAEQLLARLEHIENVTVPVKYITPEVIHASTIFGKNNTQTEETEVNTLVNNVIFRYYSDGLTY